MDITATIFLGLVSVAFVLVFFLMMKVYGKTDTMLFFTMAFIFGLIADSGSLAVGSYQFGTIIDAQFQGILAPIAIALSWPWVLGFSLFIADYFTNGPKERFLLAPLIAVGIDLIFIEPIAMQSGMWNWVNPVVDGWVAPWFNYFGWWVVAMATCGLWYLFSSERANKAEAEKMFKILGLRGGNTINSIGELQRLASRNTVYITHELAQTLLASGKKHGHGVLLIQVRTPRGGFDFAKEDFDFDYIFPDGSKATFTIMDIPLGKMNKLDGKHQMIYRWLED